MIEQHVGSSISQFLQAHIQANGELERAETPGRSFVNLAWLLVLAVKSLSVVRWLIDEMDSLPEKRLAPGTVKEIWYTQSSHAAMALRRRSLLLNGLVTGHLDVAQDRTASEAIRSLQNVMQASHWRRKISPFGASVSVGQHLRSDYSPPCEAALFDWLVQEFVMIERDARSSRWDSAWTLLYHPTALDP